MGYIKRLPGSARLRPSIPETPMVNLLKASPAIATLLLLTGLGNTATAQSIPQGVYRATPPIASSPRLDLTLRLHDNGTAELLTDPLTGAPPILETGLWRSSGRDVIGISFNQTNGEYHTPSNALLLRLINGRLVPVVYDQQTYGSTGFTLEPYQP